MPDGLGRDMGEKSVTFDAEWSRSDSHREPSGCGPDDLTVDLRDQVAIENASKLREPRPATPRECEGLGSRKKFRELGKRAKLDVTRLLRGHFSCQVIQAIVSLPDAYWGRVLLAGVDECWRWIGCHRDGNPDDYGFFAFHAPWEKEKRLWKAHRLMAAMVYGPMLLAPAVTMHECDNPWCVNPLCLSLGTQRDNVQDSLLKGRRSRCIPIQEQLQRVASG